MKKYLLSGLVLVSFLGYSVYIKGSEVTKKIKTSSNPSIFRFRENEDDNPQIIQKSITTNLTTPKTSTVLKPTTSPVTTPTGKYKDGTYTGNVADAYYGNIQVQAVITNGNITDVIFLQYPNDRNTSIEINTQAMPILRQEAIQAQNAQVNGVTGASATSAAFVESLTSALSQAV
jgi:uncharacterized protein with FMN-binding domain